MARTFFILAAILVSTVFSKGQDGTGGTFSMALTGDAIITRKLSVYKEPPFLKMIGIICSADVALTNFEMLLHDYEPYPMAESGGTYMRGKPLLANEIKWVGFDMVALANNHTGDYGVRGYSLRKSI